MRHFFNEQTTSNDLCLKTEQEKETGRRRNQRLHEKRSSSAAGDSEKNKLESFSWLKIQARKTRPPPPMTPALDLHKNTFATVSRAGVPNLGYICLSEGVHLMIPIEGANILTCCLFKIFILISLNIIFKSHCVYCQMYL